MFIAANLNSKALRSSEMCRVSTADFVFHFLLRTHNFFLARRHMAVLRSAMWRALGAINIALLRSEITFEHDCRDYFAAFSAFWAVQTARVMATQRALRMPRERQHSSPFALISLSGY